MNARLLFILFLLGGCAGGIGESGDAGRLDAAEAALRGGSPRAALQIATEVLHDDPDSARAAVVQGDSLASLGQTDRAEASYQRALRLDPHSRPARTGLARLRLGTDLAEAERMFLELSREDPRDATALNNLGIARDLQRHHRDAQTAYRESLTVNADQQAARVNLALSLAMSGQGPAAIALVEPMATAPDATRKLRHNHAAVLALAGRRSEAERILAADLPPAEVRQALAALEDFRDRPRLVVASRNETAAPVVAPVAGPAPEPGGGTIGASVGASAVEPVLDAAPPNPTLSPVGGPVVAPAPVGASTPPETTMAPESTAPSTPPRAPETAQAAPPGSVDVSAAATPVVPTPAAQPTRPGGGVTTVQLGALPSEGAARAAWDRLNRQQPALLIGRDPMITAAEVNGKTFWRLRTAGFADAAEARAFCSRIRAAGGACIIAAF